MDTTTRQHKARAYILDNLKPGMTIYNVYHYQQRKYYVTFFYITTGGRPINITRDIALAGDYRRSKDGFLITTDIDVLIYNLAYQLYPDGFDCLGKDCPSPDHRNRPHDAHTHHDGGHAFTSHDL